MDRSRSAAVLGLALLGAAAVYAASSSETASGGVTLGSLASWSKGVLSGPSMDPAAKTRRLERLKVESEWKNDLVLFWMPQEARDAVGALGGPILGPVLMSWLRNFVAGMLLYYGVGGLWAAYIYWWDVDNFYPTGKYPSKADVWKQIWVSTKAIPLYTALPAVTEAMVERGWTLAYSEIAEVGFARYFVYFWAYMLVVEFGVYWAHRTLHEVKPLYKALHRVHHVYNKEHTLSPFAGLAFHPIDGIIQAAPYVVALFFVPMHMFTHEVLLFKTAVWTTNIHDCIDGHTEPIMGAAYHTVHHTLYNVNYGHYFTYMDQIFGTVKVPGAPPAKKAK